MQENVDAPSTLMRCKNCFEMPNNKHFCVVLAVHTYGYSFENKVWSMHFSYSPHVNNKKPCIRLATLFIIVRKGVFNDV